MAANGFPRGEREGGSLKMPVGPLFGAFGCFRIEGRKLQNSDFQNQFFYFKNQLNPSHFFFIEEYKKAEQLFLI